MFNNPYMNTMPMNNQFSNPATVTNYSPMRQEIIKVNGENGARAFQMYPNSSALLLDETNPLVWVVQTDGAGYKTVTPYKLSPYQQNTQFDMSTIEARISRLEEIVNAKSNSTDVKRKQKSSEPDE